MRFGKGFAGSLLAGILILIACSNANSAPVTFQDGLNSYSGTRDSMIGWGENYGDNMSQNFGSVNTFRVYCDHYVSG